MLNVKEIQPLTDFLRNHKPFISRLQELKSPVLLTVNGRAEIVVQDADSYNALIERLNRMETIIAVREGIASAERGELKSAERVIAEMKAKYDIQG